MTPAVERQLIKLAKEALAYIEDVIVSDADVEEQGGREHDKKLAKRLRAVISKAEG